MHMNAQHCACNPHAIRGAGENQIFVACRESIRVICCDGPFAYSCRKLHAKYMCFEQEWQGCVSLCMRGHARGWQSRGWGRCSIANSGPAAMPVLLICLAHGGSQNTSGQCSLALRPTAWGFFGPGSSRKKKVGVGVADEEHRAGCPEVSCDPTCP